MMTDTPSSPSPPPLDPSHTVTEGHVTALRLVDIAYAIDLEQAQTLWSARAGRAARARLNTTPPKAMAFGDPPLALTLPPARVTLDGQDHAAEVTARVHAFGVITIALRFPVLDLPWDDFASRVNAVDRALGSHAHAETWPGILAHLREVIGPAITRPNRQELAEDYLLATVHTFDRPTAPADIGRTLDLVPLLSGETRPLSDTARADLTARRFSYFADDLVVLTWDRAFLYEPGRETDIADVLEMANAQLLEMRWYDELLDAELPRMYDLVEEATRRRTLGPRRFAELARKLYTLVAEVTELTEKVDNALQVTEDVYLARVYSAALDLFRIKSVQAAVDRKLAIIRDTYSALYDEAASSRAGQMETAIVILIVIEVLLAIFNRH